MATPEQRIRRALEIVTQKAEAAFRELAFAQVPMEYRSAFDDACREVDNVERAARDALAAGDSCPRCGRGGECPCP